MTDPDTSDREMPVPEAPGRETPSASSCDVSVVVSTYNRADRLPAALGALVDQVGDVAYEIIVVDNNSTDATAQVVAAAARSAGGRIQYLFEPRQGLSYGRNTGIARSRAPIIALCDDDVRVARDWVLQIKRTLDLHPKISYVGGRVLPYWIHPPPGWLTTSHWSPLALQDYGADRLVSGRERAVCLVGANLAFRRHVFDTVGLFTPALGRVKDGIGSTEDHDMQLRIWRAGMVGLYEPAVEVVADVTPDRMLKAYHRRWHSGHGRHCALMRLRELVPADLGPMSEPKDLVTLFGSPGFVYMDVMRTGYRWLGAVCRRKDALFYAHQLRHVCSYLRTRYGMYSTESGRPAAAELVAFVRAYFRKKMSRRAPRASGV